MHYFGSYSHLHHSKEASLDDCLTDPEHHLTLPVLPTPNWAIADWQDLHGETPQGSSSTSDPRDEFPKGDMEHQHALTTDGLDCGHSHPEARCSSCPPRVMWLHMSPRPQSDSRRGVQAWWPLGRKYSHPHPVGKISPGQQTSGVLPVPPQD